jgi:hypothetical protein
MTIIKIIVISIVLITFISGFVVILNDNAKIVKPPEEHVKTRLMYPDLLVRNGNKLSLLNNTEPSKSKLIIFEKLDDYKVYRKSVGENKPIIYLREENDVQGKDIYKIYPSPFKCEIGAQSIPLKKRKNKKEKKNETFIFNDTGYMSYDNTEVKEGKFNV